MAADASLDEVDFLDEKDLYKILGVSRGAKADDIKKAYRKRSLKHHPDKNPGDPNAKEKFQRIAEAMSILSDDKKRLRYDKSGDMDLENFDIDSFMNMWVGEMMEEGGMVDEMMKEVVPWTSDADKMVQFMEEKVKPQGKKLLCTLCSTATSNQRLMQAHFEAKHQSECEEWAAETLKSMKDSFSSFMKQITGIGDESGTFVLPDGTKADISKVKGVPDIRSHMQKRLDKAKNAEAVMEMYRKIAAEGSTYTPTAKEVETVCGVSPQEAEALKDDKETLMELLRVRIEQINNEDDEEEMMQAMGGMDGMAGLEGFEGLGGLGGFGKGFGKGGGKFGGLGGLGGGMGGLEAMLGGADPAELEEMMSMMGSAGGMQEMMAMMGGIPGMPGMGGLLGMGGAGGMGAFGGLDPRMMGGLGGSGGSRGSREQPRDTGPSQDIGCKCGYSCGTMKALEKHLDRFKGDAAHAAIVTERPPSPPRRPACTSPGGAEEAASRRRAAPRAR